MAELGKEINEDLGKMMRELKNSRRTKSVPNRKKTVNKLHRE